jgi:hypothetical protein
MLSILLLFLVEVYQNLGGGIREWLARKYLPLRWILLLGLIFYILIFGAYGPGYDASDFIYGGF